MSLNTDPNQRNKLNLRDADSARARITTNDSHPPPPPKSDEQITKYSLH